eukprot:CAMPEP_0184864580 /NCGR_PEP_ID=MMETSP0580-20130426/15461_1 /TAXON_ID=1118495 /ORGANISM="Dactyliosolen fragilissimus" /LENGTH=312 /DNA_ID=CAMNT_0027363441 /DNA_START=255 /DNA_END=1193 /DNA_ORIENTATION=+
MRESPDDSIPDAVLKTLCSVVKMSEFLKKETSQGSIDAEDDDGMSEEEKMLDDIANETRADLKVLEEILHIDRSDKPSSVSSLSGKRLFLDDIDDSTPRPFRNKSRTPRYIIPQENSCDESDDRSDGIDRRIDGSFDDKTVRLRPDLNQFGSKDYQILSTPSALHDKDIPLLTLTPCSPKSPKSHLGDTKKKLIHDFQEEDMDWIEQIANAMYGATVFKIKAFSFFSKKIRHNERTYQGSTSIFLSTSILCLGIREFACLSNNIHWAAVAMIPFLTTYLHIKIPHKWDEVGISMGILTLRALGKFVSKKVGV